MDDAYSLENYYKRSDRFVSRRIAGEAVLVPLRPMSGNYDHIYALNETAASAWNLLDGSHSLRAVVDQIVTDYEVDESEAVQDVLGLVRELIGFGALEQV